MRKSTGKALWHLEGSVLILPECASFFLNGKVQTLLTATNKNYAKANM